MGKPFNARPALRRATMLLPLLLAACSNTPSTGAGNTYEYLPGKDYSWSSGLSTVPYENGKTFPWHGPNLTPQALQAQYLSDLSWTSASNGYGPVELDRSNGQSGKGDGNPITLRGATYSKGLGAHANSTITYALGGACTTFTATVGIDDEVGGRGTVAFQVYVIAGATRNKVFDSGVVTGTSPVQQVSVSVQGQEQLQLVITDGGDNNYYDHADWANAQVMCGTTTASGDKFLSDLTPISASNGYGPYEKDMSNGQQAQADGQAITIGGVTYRKGLGAHAASQLEYALNGQCNLFTADIGIDDEVGDRGSVVFQVYGIKAGTLSKLFDSGTVYGADAARPVSVSMTGMDTLRLVVTNAGDNSYYDHADWANAKISCSSTAPTITGVTVNPATLTMNPGNVAGLTASVTGTGAYDPAVTWTSSAPSVATVDVNGKVTAVAPGQVTITATSVADTTKSGTSQITVLAGNTLPPDGVKINFQPSTTTPPSGYTADTGAPYSATTGYGWVTEASLSLPSDSHVGLDVSANARDRAVASFDTRQNTLIHMQYQGSTSLPGTRTPAAWEYALPDGIYTVTVTVGDTGNNYDSTHQISAEGQKVISGFVPTATRHLYTAAMRVRVSDGRLTLSAAGGTNTKIVSVTVAPGDRPSVRVPAPQDGETMINPSASVTADLNLTTSAVNLATLNSNAVQLINVSTGTPVNASLNTSGGGDVVVLQPVSPLASNTTYRFVVNANLKDGNGQSFLPFETTFTTGSPTTSGSTVAFEQVSLQASVPTKAYTSLEIGPDNKLYAATMTGEILRFGMNADGTLTAPQVITSVQAANGGPRTIIGMKFDPASTADNLIMWISNNALWTGTAAPNWSGKITRLSGPDLGTVQDVVVGLPRSVRDHMTNSVSFRPGEPNVLYILQGAQSAMGAPDNAWGNRTEELLSGALLRLDLSKLGTGPLNVQTGEGGTYNPYASGAPLTVYASGIRNAFDMVWHSNGQLYVPTNGSAAGGNTPGTPALPTPCANGTTYTGPAVPALQNVSVRNDYLFRVQQGGYYGHPNPLRCEWVLNGGNPTSGTDPAEVTEYPVGTVPTWRGFSYDFGPHASANGVIEEYTLDGNSALKNKLMVVRYSAGKDIIVLTPGGTNQDIVGAQTLITGLTNFTPSPLDLIENRANGYIYVAQLDEYSGSGTITLVRPK